MNTGQEMFAAMVNGENPGEGLVVFLVTMFQWQTF